jgi:hypothetical protein
MSNDRRAQDHDFHIYLSHNICISSVLCKGYMTFTLKAESMEVVMGPGMEGVETAGTTVVQPHLVRIIHDAVFAKNGGRVVTDTAANNSLPFVFLSCPDGMVDVITTLAEWTVLARGADDGSLCATRSMEVTIHYGTVVVGKWWLGEMVVGGKEMVRIYTSGQNQV